MELELKERLEIARQESKSRDREGLIKDFIAVAGSLVITVLLFIFMLLLCG